MHVESNKIMDPRLTANPSKCSICGLKFYNLECLTQHINNHILANIKGEMLLPDVKVYEASIAVPMDSDPIVADDFEKAAIGLDDDNCFICTTDNCNQLFTTMGFLHEHLVSHQSQKSVPGNWPDFNKNNCSSEELSVEFTYPKTNRCSLCGIKFYNRQYLVQHVKTHVADPMVDTVCTKNSNNQISETEDSYTNQTLPRSDIQNNFFVDAPIIDPHSQDQYVCDLQGCNRLYKTKGGLLAHKRKSHVDYYDRRRACPCINCVNRLHKSNGRARKHICDFDGCGKIFPRPVLLLKHRRTHTQQPFVCNFINCGQRFIYKARLDTHRNMHINISNTVSGQCEKMGVEVEVDTDSTNDTQEINRNDDSTPQPILPTVSIDQNTSSLNTETLQNLPMEINTGTLNESSKRSLSINQNTNSPNSVTEQDVPMEIKTEILDEYGEYEIQEQTFMEVERRKFICQWNMCCDSFDSGEDLKIHLLSHLDECDF